MVLWQRPASGLLETLADLVAAYLEGHELHETSRSCGRPPTPGASGPSDFDMLLDDIARPDPSDSLWVVGSRDALRRGDGEFKRESREEFWSHVDEDRTGESLDDEHLGRPRRSSSTRPGEPMFAGGCATIHVAAAGVILCL